MGSRSIMTGFRTLQAEEIRIFLKNVLDNAEGLKAHIRSSDPIPFIMFSCSWVSVCSNSGAIILKILYGYTTKKNGRDPLVDLANEAMAQFSLATQPGLWMVDIIPARKSL